MRRAITFLTFLMLLSAVVLGQRMDFCSYTSVVLHTLQEKHVNPPALDDTWKAILRQEFIHQLDPQGLYLTEADARELAALLPVLTDLSASVDCQWISPMSQVYEGKLKVVDQWLEKLGAQRLDFTKEEFISNEYLFVRERAKTAADLEKRWMAREKFLVLGKIASERAEPNEITTEKTSVYLKQFVSSQRNKIASLQKDHARSAIGQAWLKALALSFDPHTTFFSKADFRDFQSALATSTLSFGLDLSATETGEPKVSRLVPGGPAWNTNTIHVGDVLKKIQLPDGKVIDADGLSLHEIEDILSSAANDKVEIVVKRTDGSLATVKLAKESMETTDNKVQSLILRGNQTIGYISLPDFYTNWDDPRGTGCANDVAKELLKLKKEKISGLILDLRYNGGGSLKEAIELAGIFIDFGPLLIMQSKSQPPMILKDLNRGIAYDGPLVILVNSLSASASEMVAATLQDYHRAVIVGSPTYGKSTAQAIFPIVDRDTCGFVKVTDERVYRVTSKSYQLQGVMPDIRLPDVTDKLGFAERLEQNAIRNDSISKKVVYTPGPVLPINQLGKKSQQRLASSPWSTEVSQFQQLLQQPVPLELHAFLAYQHALTDAAKKIAHTAAAQPEYKVEQNKFDATLLETDAYRREVVNTLLKEIEKSPTIEEAFHILEDLINLKK